MTNKVKFPTAIRLPLLIIGGMLLCGAIFSSSTAGISGRFTNASLGLMLLLLGSNPAAVLWNMPEHFSEKERIRAMLIVPVWFRTLGAISCILFATGVILQFRS